MNDNSGLFDLTGRSALVTGAAGGIGAAVAQALARAGAAVLVTDVDGEAAAAVAGNFRAAGLTADSAALDVRDRAAADAAAARAAELADGTLHIVVNNAGVTAPAMFDNLAEDDFRRIVDIHLMGPSTPPRRRCPTSRRTARGGSSTSRRRPVSSGRSAR
ncbi:SDR family NAD(P)-dependent oxidoreductase [Streptomyces sp. NBC_00576]|nr:SDR family NAD(P)-dependent oxidoreductase [Streptomyces sp. NBC_00576]WUB76703.1 SDR family NAD(P)-dependent oxidoreductase [Streptomyces sp. NBC_00576]